MSRLSYDNSALEHSAYFREVSLPGGHATTALHHRKRDGKTG